MSKSKENMNNSIFENMLLQYSPTTKEGKDNAMHEVIQSAAEVLPFRQRLRGFTKTVCCATLTHGYENKALRAICAPIYHLEHT